MKLLLKTFIFLILLLLLAMLTLVLVVDPNDYKEQIQTQAKQSLNRDLHINGDLSWTFYPQLGLSSGEIEINNLAGFNRENLIKISSASIGIQILPLLTGQLKISELNLEGFTLNIITNKNGVSNLDHLGSQTNKKNNLSEKTTKSTVNNTNNESFFDMSKLVFEGINITNTVIEIQDLANKSYNHIRIQKMHLSQFEFSKDSDFTLISEVLFNNIKINITLTSKINISQDMTRISLKDLILNSQFSGPDIPNGKLTSTLKTNAIYQIKSKKLTLNPFQIMLDKIKLKGQVSVQNGALTKVRYTLFGNQWDLNPYLSKKSTITPATKNKNKIQNTNNRNTSAPEIEPNLSFLTHLDVQGDLTIAGILYENIKIGEITTKLFIKKGKASLNPLNIKLYKGQLNAKASIDDAKGKNIYQINTQLKGVQLRPLLIDVAEIDFISGQTAFTFNGTGRGLTAASIKQGLTGQGNFSLLDGEIYGVNIHQDIRRLKAKLKGKKPPTEKDIKKTDFASLNGDFTLGNGIINNQKLLMLSPILRLDGTGLINIINNTLDYQLSIAPLSQRGTETEQFDLKGVVIPMHIKGSLTDPKFSLDMQGALKAQLKEKVNAEKKRLQRKLENKLKGRLDDKSKQFLKKEGKEIENLLKGLFG